MAKTEKLEIVIKGKDEASPKLKPVSEALGNIATVAGGIIASKALGMVGDILGGIASSTVDLIKAAPELKGVQDAFTALFGDPKDAEGMLEALKESSNYMITNTELMKDFNLAASLVGEDFAEQLPSALELLNRYAGATGEDVGGLLERLIRGVGRLSIEVMDDMGVVMDAQKAYENYAKSLGIAESEIPGFIDGMTKSQQQAAFMQEAMTQLAAKTATMATISDPFKQLETTITDLKDLISVELGPIVLPILTELAEQLRVFVESDEFQTWIKETGEWLKTNLIPTLQNLITNTGGVSGVFNTLKGIINFISTILTPFIEGWKLLVGLFEKVKMGIENILTPLIELDRYIEIIKTGLSGLSLPDWLTPGSPTPLELGLKGINEQMKNLPVLNMNANVTPMAALAMRPNGGTAQVVVNYSPMVSFATAAEFEERLLPVIARAQRKLQRGR